MPTARVGFLAGDSEPPPYQLGDLGKRCKLPNGVRPRKIWIMEHFGASEITSEWSQQLLAFESETTSESEGGCPLPQRRTAPDFETTDTGLVYRAVCLFTPQLSLVLVAPTRKDGRPS